MPSETTSRWRRLAALLFAPGRFGFPAALLWLFLTFIVWSLLGLFPIVHADRESVTFVYLDGRFTPFTDPRDIPREDHERWRSVVVYERQHRVYAVVETLDFSLFSRYGADAAPLGPPDAAQLAALREATATALADAPRSVPFDQAAVDMLAASEDRRITWSTGGTIAWLLLWLVRLLPIMAATIFTARGVRWIKFERRHARCRRGLCPICRYSLTDLTTSTCPECGCNTSATCAQAARLLGAAERDESNPST